MKRIGLRREVASAVLSNELPSAQDYQLRNRKGDMLVELAKRLQRLQTKRRKVMRELVSVTKDISRAKKELRALCALVSKGEA